ncbi:hypothetical protein [Brucella intermedia]|uniref:Uncharacterized protein n=1 Tax=Brucella intermedia M86 TaxID=1234597 RepID=M5JLC3_9HYPH|nr:hypothetical protein [Brucella intermedia]ELT47407.1 hypothetical protein D584_19943 [Brucella intermedia M86]
MSRFTAKQKLAEAERELAYRHRVYRRLVSTGKMKLEEAQRRIGIMTEIVDDYRNAASDEPDLFKRNIT